MFDDLMTKQFNLRAYNCWDLTREVWLRLTGQDLGSPCFTHYTINEMGELVDAWNRTKYEEIPKPKEPCIVLMQRERHMPHVGVWSGGRVMHIRRAGVQYVPVEVASLGFSSVRYYVPCPK